MIFAKTFHLLPSEYFALQSFLDTRTSRRTTNETQILRQIVVSSFAVSIFHNCRRILAALFLIIICFLFDLRTRNISETVAQDVQKTVVLYSMSQIQGSIILYTVSNTEDKFFFRQLVELVRIHASISLHIREHYA